MSNESPDLTTLNREQLARMVGDLCERIASSTGIQRGEFESESNYIESVTAELKAQIATLESVIRAKDREIEQSGASIDDREGIITRQGKTLAAARAEVERLTRMLAATEGIYEMAAEERGRYEDAFSVLRAKFGAQSNAEALDSIDRLRAALAQVGEKVKVECVKLASDQETYWRNRPNQSQTKEARANEAAQIAALISGAVDIAAIVAASAETKDTPSSALRCSSCGGSAPPMRKDNRNQIACDDCFRKWIFNNEKYRNEWRIVEAAAEGQEANDGKG